MAITVGELRTYCAEVAAPDPSDPAADREFMEWINGALGRLHRETGLDLTRREEKVVLPAAVAGVDLAVTAGSLVAIRATGTFSKQWLDERWALHIEGEPDAEFEIASLAGNGGAQVTANLVFAAITITRAAGSWITDGYVNGDYVTITAAEDVANVGTFGPVTNVTATVLTIGSAAFTVNVDDDTAVVDRTQKATFRAGDEWIQATGTGLDFHAVKHRFAFGQALEIERVQLPAQGYDLEIVLPATFDRVKLQQPTARGVTPSHGTFREGHVEVWPGPGDDYLRLALTYRLAYSPLATAAADSVEVEWPEVHRDVLRKAILLEASITQGKESPVPYPLAVGEYVEAVKALRATATKDMQPGPLAVNLGRVRRPWRISNDWITELVDLP